MKTFGISLLDGKEKGKNINFDGKRVLHNTVAQLGRNNPYSLTEPNQRAISKAIAELGKIGGTDNVKFLANLAAKNAYSVNIALEDRPKNDWSGKLLAAAMSALALTATAGVELVDKVMKTADRGLNNDEKHILKLRDNLIKSADLEQIERETVGSIKDFVRNLDYFIVSSETTTKHKKYVLERLNYFMSDKYEINHQLADKKSVVLAEMINDMAISVPGNKVPNIKAVNQKQHGICAVISIVRKKLAYEDKPNYVDSILSELDSTDTMSVYDRTALGSGRRIQVDKVPVDFTSALKKGYRIIDASSAHWMQIADMTGFSNVSYNIYNPFDSENFDVKTDAFFNTTFDDTELGNSHLFYQSLIKANEVIEDYKAAQIKKSVAKHKQKREMDENLDDIVRVKSRIRQIVTETMPEISEAEVKQLISGLTGLQRKFSDEINNEEKYAYIPNEEMKVKKLKVSGYIKQNTGIEISEDNADRLLDMLNYYHGLQDMVKHNSPRTRVLRKAQNLYEIGAAFRHAVIMSLEERGTLHRVMKEERIPDEVNLIYETIDKMILHLNENRDGSDLIIKHLSGLTDSEINNCEDAIGILIGLRNAFEGAMAEKIDDIYYELGLGSKNNVMAEYINKRISEVNDGNKDTIFEMSQVLKCDDSKDAVYNALTKQMVDLESDGGRLYWRVYNTLGGISQVKDLFENYKLVIERIREEEDSQERKIFAEIHKLQSEDEEGINNVLLGIGERILSLDNAVNQYQQILKVLKPDGDILYSAEPKDAVIRIYENNNVIPSYRRLKVLQKHLDDIKKDRSTDEFSSRQGRLRDKSLYKFSEYEKETLRQIEAGINPMHSYTEKNIKSLRAHLSADLEELKRIIGVNSGHYWVTQEGSSGLHTEQEIKILEYMTGRPHYSTKNIADAINKIKTSPYSGISSSSVYHDKIGMHAQYIADIAPVRVKVKDKDGNIKEETREVLFNDNTWGASEHENTWIDSMGLMRTDYSDGRGGSLGYITDEMFRNGNLVSRITGDMVLKEHEETVDSKGYKKIKPADDESYNMPQYNGIILDGKSPELKEVADEIHDTLFVPLSTYIERLKVLSKDMTKAEAEQAINDVELAGRGFMSKYKELQRRIFEDGKFGKRINTRADYEALADDDYLKVILEKIALKMNYPRIGREADIAKITNLKDFDLIRKSQRRHALAEFKYAFGKNSMVIEYIVDKFTDKEIDELIKVKNKYGLNISDDNFLELFDSVVIPNKKEYDGSLKSAINIMLGQIEGRLDKNIADENAKKEMLSYLKKFFTKIAYFNKEDIRNQKIAHIVNFIDREFDPADDEDFVKVFRRMQDMTTEEFKRDVLSRVKKKDLNIKSYTGYDVLKKIRRYEESASRSLLNNVYYDEMVKDINDEEYKTVYTYNKLTRTARYLPVLNFGTVYRELKYNLDLLTYTKLFNKYKDRNINLYGAYPAYPKLDYTAGLYDATFEAVMSGLRNCVDMIKGARTQQENYSIYKKLNRYANKLDDGAVLSDYQYKNLNGLMGRFVEINYEDEMLQDALNAAYSAMDIKKGEPFLNYRKYIRIINDVMRDYEATSPSENLDLLIAANRQAIRDLTADFVKAHIQERYRNDVISLVNSVVKTLSVWGNGVEDKISELYDMYTRYHIIHNPEELLKAFIVSCTKSENMQTSVLKETDVTTEQLLRRASGYATLVHIQEILMDAMQEGVETNAKSLFNTLSVELSNGDSLPMDSDEIIKLMTHSLILDGQSDTALMFLDKLGLNERYVEYVAKDIDFVTVREYVDKTADLITGYNKFSNETGVALESAVESMKSGKDSSAVIDLLISKITKCGRANKVDKMIVKAWQNALNGMKKTLEAYPEAESSLVLLSEVDKINSETLNRINSQLSKMNDYLNSVNVVINTINQVLVNPDSEADKARAEMNKKYQEVIEYSEQKRQNLQVLE